MASQLAIATADLRVLASKLDLEMLDLYYRVYQLSSYVQKRDYCQPLIRPKMPPILPPYATSIIEAIRRKWVNWRYKSKYAALMDALTSIEDKFSLIHRLIDIITEIVQDTFDDNMEDTSTDNAANAICGALRQLPKVDESTHPLESLHLAIKDLPSYLSFRDNLSLMAQGGVSRCWG